MKLDQIKGTNMSDQATVAVESDAISKLAGLIDGPEDWQPEESLEEEEQTEEQVESEEPEEQSEEETEEPEAKEPEDPLEEITWNGETKKIPKSELKELAQKGFDYTQKTQQLAEERRSFDAQIKAAQQSLALQNQQIETVAQVKAIDSQLEQFAGINWQQLAQSDPMQYLTLNQTYRDLKDKREETVRELHGKAQKAQQLTEQAQRDFLNREHKALAELPEFAGNKAADSKAQVKDYLLSVGFTEDEIGQVFDHRQVKVAWEAAQWRKLKQSTAQVAKKIATVPKVVKPGTNKPAQKPDDREAYTNLKRTGRAEYATKLIERML